MNGPSGSVNKIIPCSFVDGPGSRFVVFLQGCNMRCPTCHNPQTRGVCTRCGICLYVCPHSALSCAESGASIVRDETLCDNCGACTDSCPHSADPGARDMTIGSIVSQLQRASPFVNGITLSGGEASCQLPFLAGLFTAVKMHPALVNMTTFLDTNGSLVNDEWDSVLLPVTDGVMVDLKSFDEVRHRAMTGIALSVVREGICRIHASGKLYEVRVLIVPGFNDDIAELSAMAAFLHQLGGGPRVRLIAYHPHRLSLAMGFKTPPTNKFMKEVRNLFMNIGLTTVSPSELPVN